MGMALGYALFKAGDSNVKISRIQVCVGWTATLVLMVGCIFGNHVFLRQDHQHDRFESSCVISMIRILWSVGVLWIIWASANGYGGKFVFSKSDSNHFPRILHDTIGIDCISDDVSNTRTVLRLRSYKIYEVFA